MDDVTLIMKYPLAPVHILDAMKRYAEDKIPTGDFIKAVLSNDLKGAMGRGDEDSLAGLNDIVRYMIWEMPMACQGSSEKVEAWLRNDTEYYGEGGTNDHLDERPSEEDDDEG